MKLSVLRGRGRRFAREALAPLYDFLSGYYGGHGFCQNINYTPLARQPRALISYITYPFDHDYGEGVRHTSRVEVALIIRAFTDLGCVVDVIDCENRRDVPRLREKRYDYIFGFGEPWAAAADSSPAAVKVMYLTECAPAFSAREEQARLDYFARRHGARLPLTRSHKYFHDAHIARASLGGFFGNDCTAAAYRSQFPGLKLRLLAPSGFKHEGMHTCPPPGDSDSFLWFGSWGAIHKGLDILLDVFRQIPTAKLYVAGLSAGEKWLLDDYRSCPNIVDMGFLDVQSETFYERMQKIPYCILPSASEGMSTSVLTCMRHGMIPVITPACGIDVDGFGYLIEDYHVEAVAELVEGLMRVSEAERLRRRRAAYADANEKYSLEAFDRGMRDFVASFVGG